MKRNLFLLIALSVCICSFGQGEIDALRMSRNDLTGTARGQAMGGAFGALGGDVTGVAINPAGIGVYRSSEIVASMNFTSTDISTNWMGTKHEQSKFKFNFDNLSYMGYFPTGSDGVQSVNFGFSYNRLKNFDRQYTASGQNMGSSLTDLIAKLTNGTSSTRLESTDSYDPYWSGLPWMSILGFQGDLIAQVNGTTDQYVPRIQGYTLNPLLSVSERGYVESYDFTAGTNISDKLYLGLTFSLTDMYYSMSSAYTENFNTGKNEGYDFYNQLETDGSGYQVSVGAIFRPVDALRVGVAYHSPTWYTSMTDYFSANTIFEYVDGPDVVTTRAWTPGGDPPPHNDYKFQTPYSWVFSAAAILGSQAVVSLDYEIKDYTAMNTKDEDGYNVQWVNDYVDQDFKVASTLRAGLEYRVTPQFSARLGYAWMQNPYTKQMKDGNTEVTPPGTIPHYTIEGDVNHLTWGVGYRFTPHFYADLAFVWRSQTDDLYYFTKFLDGNGRIVVDSTPAKLKNNTYKGLLTVGYKF